MSRLRTILRDQWSERCAVVRPAGRCAKSLSRVYEYLMCFIKRLVDGRFHKQMQLLHHASAPHDVACVWLC